MAQEPKRRHSKARKRTRRAGIKLQSAGTIICQNCGKLTLPHQVCKNCGFYGKKQVKTKLKAQVTRA